MTKEPQRGPSGTPEYIEMLSMDDQKLYEELRERVGSPDNRYNRNRRLVTLRDSFDDIRAYCIRNSDDDSDWKRCLVCGICWFGDNIAINTRQLRLLIAKSKSTINGALAKMGYETIPSKGEEANLLMKTIPFLNGHFSEMRQWTIRKLRSDFHDNDDEDSSSNCNSKDSCTEKEKEKKMKLMKYREAEDMDEEMLKIIKMKEYNMQKKKKGKHFNSNNNNNNNENNNNNNENENNKKKKEEDYQSIFEQSECDFLSSLNVNDEDEKFDFGFGNTDFWSNIYDDSNANSTDNNGNDNNWLGHDYFTFPSSPEFNNSFNVNTVRLTYNTNAMLSIIISSLKRAKNNKEKEIMWKTIYRRYRDHRRHH